MEIVVAQQVWLFLYSCLLGAALGLLYDVFRILRLAFPAPAPLVLAQDLLYFALCAVATFLFVMAQNYGQLRWFILAGELIGWVVYYLTIGVMVLGASRAIIRAVVWVLQLLYRLLVAPVVAVLRWLWRLVQGIGRLAGKMLKKCFGRLKFNLQPVRCMMYNRTVHHSRRGRGARAGGKAKTAAQNHKKKKPAS